MKAYCINLDRRPDRLEHMQRQFAIEGIPFERVAAADSRDPAIIAATALCGVSVTGLKMGPGAYACFQSHRIAWRRLVQSGDSHAMVFEDDVVLAPGIAAYLDPGWVPADAELVRLETFLTRFHRDGGPGREAMGRRLHRLRSRHAGAGCYVISAAAARRLLPATERIDDPIDELLFNEASALFDGLVVYQMIPAPAVQGDRLPPGAAQDGADWTATSIVERHAGAVPEEKVAPERAHQRLVRRLREEIRARLNRTRYELARFG